MSSCDTADMPDGYRSIESEMLSFLWYQAAGLTLQYFGVGAIRPASDADRINCVTRLGLLYQQHSDILPEEAVLIMDCLLSAAIDLQQVSGH